ncbi:MAG: carboxymuconolactone decarboxylase family protein [Gemmatimonadota bacterium]
MDDRTRALIALSSALARGARGEWRGKLTEALEFCTPVEVEETLLQSYLFIGYPTVLQAFAIWRELQPEPASVEGDSQAQSWRQRGEAVCTTIYGGQYEQLRENVIRLHPDLEQWMLNEGYGKVLARPGLDLLTRELCIIAVLASQDAPQQLYSHLRGALQAGSTPSEVDEVVLSVVRSLPSERAQEARQLWAELRARKTTEKETSPI